MTDILLAAAALFNPALESVNQIYRENHLNYQIQLNQETVAPKEPIFLKVVYDDGRETPIGVVHVIRLEGENFDGLPWTKLAKTVDEIRDAIFLRVHLYFQHCEDPAFFVTPENGQLSRFNDCQVVIQDNGTFQVDGQDVTYRGQSLRFSQLVSEAVLDFQYEGEDKIRLFDSNDRRIGKGMYIDRSTGEIKRD